MSACQATQRPPSCSIRRRVSSAAACSRSIANKVAPWRASSTAVALPLPQPGPIDPAPVTIAILPGRSSIAVSLDRHGTAGPWRCPRELRAMALAWARNGAYRYDSGNRLGKASMRIVDVLTIQRVSAAERVQIEAVDPAIRLTDACGWYDGEIRETWPAAAVARYVAPTAMGAGTRAERDRLLADAEVILGGWPFPLDLRARARRLKWFHQRPAGASNLKLGDLWGSDVMVTTSRGVANALAIAEYAVAGILHFAKGLGQAVVDRTAGRFDHRAYRPL